MSINTAKIRLGAPTSFVVGALDMGATKGGVMFKFARTQMLIECDQVLAPVTVFTTKEEASLEAAFYETQMSKLATILGLNGLGNITTTPGSPSTDQFKFGGQVYVARQAADLTIPKNDNSVNNLLVHLNYVHGYKEMGLDFARDKDTTFKGVFNALADPTALAGQQLGYITEQY